MNQSINQGSKTMDTMVKAPIYQKSKQDVSHKIGILILFLVCFR